MAYIPTREQAWELLQEYTQSEQLLKHALAVEGVMRHFAAHLEQPDVEMWGVVGLLHDLDYEKYPEEHCVKVQEILRERGVDEMVVRAIASHGYGLTKADVEPQSLMEKVLYAVDELTGLINATALMRPSRSVMDLSVKSVKKKYKSPSFAAGVSRETIEDGLQRLGWELDYLIEQTILGMRSVADAIGLGGAE